MAIYHYSASVIGRSKAKSAVAAAAYRAGEKIEDRRTGLTHDYTKKTGVDHSEIITPYLPDVDRGWLTNRAELWNQVEVSERRYDSQLAREINIAIPTELDRNEQIALVREYVKTNYVDLGMVADVNFHNLESNNPHSHIMLTMRSLIITAGHVEFGNKNREWNSKDLLIKQRQSWEILANQYLTEAGYDRVRIDCRTLEEQGINRIPQIHLGTHAASMRANGIPSRIGDEYDRIEAANNNMRQQLEEIYNDNLVVVDLDGQCESLSTQIRDLEIAINRDLSFLEQVDPGILARINSEKLQKPKPLTSTDLTGIVGEDRAKRIVEWASKNLIIPDGQTEIKHESNSLIAKMSAINIDPNTVTYIFTDIITAAQLKIICSKSSGEIPTMSGSITGAILGKIKAIDGVAIQEILRGFTKRDEVAEPKIEPPAVTLPESEKIEPVTPQPQVSISASELPTEVLVNIPEDEKIEPAINQPTRRVVNRGRSYELG